MREVAVVGVGMTRFGRRDDKTMPELGVEATLNALRDSGIAWKTVQLAYCAAANQGLAAGTRVLEAIGMTGIPIINVENASASGSTAFREAYLAVASGAYDVALALGVGKIGKGGLSATDDVRETNISRVMGLNHALSNFALKMNRRMHDYGSSIDSFARIAVKNHHHGALNPYAQIQKEVTVEEVHASRMGCDPLTVLHMCPISDGAAAAILCSTDVAAKCTKGPLITVAASVFKTQAYRSRNCPGPDVTEVAAKEAYEQAGMGPWDMDLVQVHDAATIEEVESYEFLGYCKYGEGERLIDEGATQIGGKIPFNTDGGLLTRGHPLGPTGLAQIWETVVQLRGQAGPRQVEGAKVGLAHMIGYGDVAVIHILKR